VVEEPFEQKFAARAPGNRRIQTGKRYSPEEVRDLIDAYDGCIAYLDYQLGWLFDELRSRGALENTLVIITSDHGEEFGEHGVMGHGNSLYMPSVHVPLLILFPPYVPAGMRVREPASLRDIPATVADLAGLGGEHPFPGQSLARYWKGPCQPGEALLAEAGGAGCACAGRGPALPPAGQGPFLTEVNFARNLPPSYPVCKGDMKALVAGRYHYIRNGDGQEELYDFAKDPLERQDLAGSDAGRCVLERFRASLGTMLASDRMRQ
jgi:hypothetical protein